MLPLRSPYDLPAARDGLLLLRSLPRMRSEVKNDAAVVSMGVPHVAPPSSLRTNPTVLWNATGERDQARNTSFAPTAGLGASSSGVPLGPKRGIDAWPSPGKCEAIARGLHVGAASSTLSEKVVYSSRPGATGRKFVQLRMTRPVERSTSMNSLSAKSRGTPCVVRSPFGLEAGGMMNGPSHVWPQSVDRWKPIVCTVAVALNLAMTIEE